MNKQYSNHLSNQTSPYLLQHQDNPVKWYPWGQEAFSLAKAENKPIFLSIGYSTCHWCHVMAHECFEDEEVAAFLNENFVSIKVDKEERPDIDSTYMNVCISLTGSGGWPMTVIMDASGRPFFAGTYFPKHRRYGMPGLLDILNAIHDKWTNERDSLLTSAQTIVTHINAKGDHSRQTERSAETLVNQGIAFLQSTFDQKYGGFGSAPKFPSPHNLLFLMKAYQAMGNKSCLAMVEKTLMPMAKGGIFDHIGFGFSRYSTDEKWLAPHFEKMLYDNALLVMAYTQAFEITKDPIHQNIVKKTLDYIAREMTATNGGFYSAQDADSDGIEGKYYVFSPDEIISVLGAKDGEAFCKLYDITEEGNFEGQSIPNQIHIAKPSDQLSHLLPALYDYRKTRNALHKDDKILTSWNALMIAALCDAAIVFEHQPYLDAAIAASNFTQHNLCDGTQLFASFRDGKRTDLGFIDDYAFYIYSLIKLYNATLTPDYLRRAQALMDKAISDFYDHEHGGFYLYGNQSEALISRPKETYDGAIPSGNSVMAMNLLLLTQLGYDKYQDMLDQQMVFVSTQISDHPAAGSFFLYTLLHKDFPESKITAVLAHPSEKPQVKSMLRGKGLVRILDQETEEYHLLNGQTTFYSCEGHVCHPPTNKP